MTSTRSFTRRSFLKTLGTATLAAFIGAADQLLNLLVNLLFR